MRLGIFGGTFDPPHIGHLILASEAMEQLDLERLLWVLTPDPPHKQEKMISPSNIRLELLQAAIADNARFELSRVELDRPGPHYALDTVALLRGQFPGWELVYLIGGDSLRDLPTWHEPQALVRGVDAFGVMPRPDADYDLPALEATLPGLAQKTLFLDVPLIEISSTDIRARLAHGRSARYFLPAPVYDRIAARGYYRREPRQALD
jgi:nicotinate-nucleotide adenylyltransferase